MKQTRLHRIFLIMILALGMTGGSFITSMATVATDVVPEDAAAVTEIAPEATEQEEVLEETEAIDSDATVEQEPQEVELAEADADVHGDDCEHCKAQAEKESETEVEVIKAVQQVAPTVIATPAANSVANTPDSGESNPPAQEGEGKDKEQGPLDNQPPVEPQPQSEHVEEDVPEPNKAELEPDIDFEAVERIKGHNVSYHIDNYVAPTCEIPGSYDLVRRCRNNNCGLEDSVFSQESKVIPPLGHTPGKVVEENRNEPTCVAEGSYDEVVYCSVCKKELSRKTHYIEALGHIPGEPVIKNEKEASYDEVISCTVCKEEISRETIKIAVYVPKQVIIEDPIMNNTHVADIDDNGRAVIKGFFKNLNTGGSAKETYTMEVAGKSYTFTVYSDGTVSGNLPKGFSVNGYDLIVETKEPLDINIADRGATSSISYEPELGVPEKGGEEDDGYWAPIIPEVPAEVDATYNPTPSTSAPRSHNNAADEVVTAGTTATNTGGTNTANTSNTTPAVTPAEEQVAAVEEALEVPSILADIFGDSHDADSANSSVGEEVGVTPSKLLIAADIALVAGLIVGLCALWKLGILKF